MKRKIKAGSTSVTLPIFVQDTSSTTGGGLGALVFNTAGLTAKYRRQGQATWTTITLADITTIGTFVSGGFKADGGVTGSYEFHPPDAALAAGAKWASIQLSGAANMLPVLIEIELDAVDYQDAAGFGLSRLDATVGSRSSHTPAQVATTVFQDLTSGADFGTANSIGALLKKLTFDANNAVAANIVDAGGNPATPLSLADIADAVWDEARAGHTTAGTFGFYLDAAISGVSTGGVSAGQIATAVWQDLLASADFGTAGSIGKLLKDDIDAKLSTLLTAAGYTAPPTAAAVATAVFTTAMAESYAADGAMFTLAQAQYMLWSLLQEFAIVGNTITSKKLDGNTPAMTHTLDSATEPRTRTRAS